MIKLTETVKHLIIINVLFFLATIAFREQIYGLLVMHYPTSDSFRFWQLITSLFMHADERHLISNMIGLFIFGGFVEQRIGRKNFLILYFSAGVGAILFSTGIDFIQINSIYNKLLNFGLTDIDIKHIIDTGSYNSTVLQAVTEEQLYDLYGKSIGYSLGASGAVMGLMAAIAVLFPNAIFFLIPIELKYYVPFTILAEVYMGVLRTNDNIGHFAHVGGAIVGFLLIWSLKRQHFKRWF